MLLSPFSLASKVQIFHPFARCFCACFRGLYKPYWKGFPLRMLKTLLKAWKTRLYGQFSTVLGGVFNILWKTFQHNSTDKHPRSLGKLPVLPPFFADKTYNYYGGFARFFTFHRFSPPRLWTKSEKFILHVECKNSPQNSILFRPFRLLQTSPPQPAERARHCCLLRRIRSPPPPQTAAAAPAHTQ